MIEASRVTNHLKSFQGNSLRLEIIKLADVIHKLFKIFNTIAKNDALAIDFSVFSFFGNDRFLLFMDAGLQLVAIVLPFERLFPDSRQLIFEAITALMASELEAMVECLSLDRASLCVAYIFRRLAEDIDLYCHK